MLPLQSTQLPGCRSQRARTTAWLLCPQHMFFELLDHPFIAFASPSPKPADIAARSASHGLALRACQIFWLCPSVHPTFAGRSQSSIEANTHLEAYKKPMPRGPRRNFLAVADSQSQPIFFTSMGIWPTLWHASSK